MQNRFDVLRWTTARVLHAARHGVDPEEADEVLYDEGAQLRRGSDGRFLLYGRTESGRPLLVVLEDEGGRVAAPVTARDLTREERRPFLG